MSENNIAITAYLNTLWMEEGVRAIMRKHSLDYEEKDIIANPAFRWEMEQRSGQPLSPCVVVNDVMLADVSGWVRPTCCRKNWWVRPIRKRMP